MIFVTVGSQKFPFNRLLKKVDRMVRDHIITEEVCIQTGSSDYLPSHCRYQTFYDRTQFSEMLQACTILITHGGTGTIIDAVKRGKKTIVVPRLSRYGEHVDDHQLELPARFHEMNLVYTCPDENLLPDILPVVRNHQFDTYQSNTETFLASVDDFLRSYLLDAVTDTAAVP